MLTDQDEKVWKALSDPTRRRILDLLRVGPLTTGDLSDHFEVTRFAVMKHLGVLQEAGLVIVRKQGRFAWNHLNPSPIQRIYDRWMHPFARGPAETLSHLKRHVETRPDRRKR